MDLPCTSLLSHNVKQINSHEVSRFYVQSSHQRCIGQRCGVSSEKEHRLAFRQLISDVQNLVSCADVGHKFDVPAGSQPLQVEFVACHEFVRQQSIYRDDRHELTGCPHDIVVIL